MPPQWFDREAAMLKVCGSFRWTNIFAKYILRLVEVRYMHSLNFLTDLHGADNQPFIVAQLSPTAWLDDFNEQRYCIRNYPKRHYRFRTHISSSTSQ